jgi:pSer/pThr/pTyr-binding forkhead associated (FHA) protein
MSGDLGQFREACGANGPLRLEWDDCVTGTPVQRDFERPAVVVGRNPRADLVLEHPEVGRRHAYLQLVDGRLFAMDLGSRDLRWGGVPRRGGWVDRSRPVQIGPTTIRVADGEGAEDLGPGPGPTSRRYKSRAPLPAAVLDFGGRVHELPRCPLDRVLTLVGGSDRCHVRLTEQGISRVICALLRTPMGVWAVDLLSSRGISVNGVVCRQARLEDGDILRVGNLFARLTYAAAAAPPSLDAPAPRAGSVSGPGPDGSVVGSLVPALLNRPDLLFSETALRPLLDAAEPSADVAASPFGQALVLLIRLLGDMHRDHFKLVREELEQIRRINQDVTATRAGLALPARRTGARAVADGSAAANGGALAGPEPPTERLTDPEAVQSLVGERLAAWEQERRSRWQKVIELLVRP